MSALVTNMFLLMIAALLIGFIIGWLIRRSATRAKYAKNIGALKSQDDKIASELHINSVNYENSTKHLATTQDKLKKTQKQSEEYIQYSKKLNTDIEDFQLSQKTIKENLVGIDTKIQNVTEDLDILNTQKGEIQEYQKTIEKYTQDIAQKTEGIDTLRENISHLTTERDAYSRQVDNENKKLASKEQEIDEENNKIQAIKDEFAAKRAEVIGDVESTKRKALNYQYAVDYVTETIDAKEKVSFDTIDKIINKNEESGLFANLKQKLFSKSAQYIKGGK